VSRSRIGAQVSGATGATLVEVLVAVAVIGALAAIGIPQYHGYTERGREAQCAHNRYTIETAERACALDNNGKPCLGIRKLVKSGYLSGRLTCPSGGRYVWATRDPQDPHYPTIGCSKHSWPSWKGAEAKKAKKAKKPQKPKNQEKAKKAGGKKGAG